MPISLPSHTELCDVSVEKDQTPGVFNPYNTTSLNIFIREAFPGALLLEEHQVRFSLNVIFNKDDVFRETNWTRMKCNGDRY